MWLSSSSAPELQLAFVLQWLMLLRFSSVRMLSTFNSSRARAIPIALAYLDFAMDS